MKNLKIFAAAIVSVLVLSMFLSSSAVEKASAQEGVYLKIGMQDEPKTNNIFKASDVWTVHALSWLYPTLYTRAPVTLEIIPDAADGMWEVSPDGLTYTVKLKDGLKWDDGTPLVAADFQWVYDYAMELKDPGLLPVYELVESFKAVDDKTLVIKLKECTPQWEEAIVFSMAVPRHQFQPILEEARKAEEPLQAFLDASVPEPLVGAGPFSWGEWQKGSFVRLVTNKDYYRRGETVDVPGVGTLTIGPHYDGLLLKIYGTTDAALLGLQKGEIDYIWWNLDPGYIATLLGDPNITIVKSEELGFFYLALNHARKPFDDLVLRQAIATMVDKEFIVNRVLQGYGGPLYSVVTPAAGKWYNDKVNKFGAGLSKDERIAKAKEMLEAAGYKVPDKKYPDGVLILPNGQPMEPFEILTPPADYDPMRAMAGVLIQEWLREIGIPVTSRPTSFGEIVNKTFESMTFDAYILGWRIGGTGYPDHMYYFFHSEQAVPDGYNPMSYKNPEVDKLLESLLVECDPDKVLQDALKAQEMIIEEVAYIPLYYRTMNEAHRNDTFKNWFVQLGGIAGTESTRSSLVYLEPIKKAEEKPEEKAGLPVAAVLFTVGIGAGVSYILRRKK